MFMIIFIAFLSMLGYYRIICKNLEVRIEFIPIFIFSLIITTLFIAGLLNVLPQITWLILLCGVLFFTYFSYKDIKNLHLNDVKKMLKQIIVPGVIIIVGFCVYFSFKFKGIHLLHYDNFSHWALIVKEMCLNNRLPSFASKTIMFEAYPPGSALFIYFISSIFGKSDGIALMAQMLLILACLLSTYVFCQEQSNEDKKFSKIKAILSTAIMFIVTIFMFNGPSSIYDLLVDTLILLFGVTGTVIILYYKNDIMKAALLNCPIMITTLLIKNAGLFYVLINISVLFYMYFKSYQVSKTNKMKQICLLIVLVLILPLASQFLWHQHVKYLFPSGESSLHAMSVENYTSTFSGKTKDDVDKISSEFLKRTLDIESNPFTKGIFIWHIFLIFIYLLLRFLLNDKENRILLALVFIDAVWIIYLLSLYLMYLFSMPIWEALPLNAYHRYVATIYNFTECYLFIQLVIIMNTADNKRKFYMRTLGVVLCTTYFLSIKINDIKYVFQTPVYQNSVVEKVDKAHTIKNSDYSYAVYAPMSENDGYYLHYMLIYKLWTKDFTIYYDFEDLEEFKAALSDKDCLIILDDDGKINDLMRNYIERDAYYGSYMVSDIIS